MCHLQNDTKAQMTMFDTSTLQAWACWRTVWWLFLTAVPFKLLNDGAQFVGPFFLNKLLDVIEVGGSQVTPLVRFCKGWNVCNLRPQILSKLLGAVGCWARHLNARGVSLHAAAPRCSASSALASCGHIYKRTACVCGAIHCQPELLLMIVVHPIASHSPRMAFSAILLRVDAADALHLSERRKCGIEASCTAIYGLCKLALHQFVVSVQQICRRRGSCLPPYVFNGVAVLMGLSSLCR